jgi:hypothetical protein
VEKQSKSKQADQKHAFKAEREQRGEQTPPTVATQMGATEQEVAPLTPPMANSDTAPNMAKREKKTAAEEQIDPADELTPG